MNASELKERLYARHPGSGGQMPGPWTVIEEWRGIDLLAFSAWSSAEKYARVGYEVKVSRGDMRSELLNPRKRAENVAWCNSFYFAVPVGLLTDDELAWQEPEWAPEDWHGERCPGYRGIACRRWSYRGKRHLVDVPVPYVGYRLQGTEQITCPTCNGKGVVSPSRVEREAPTLWVPRDVGLVVVDGRGTRVVRASPKRKEVPALGPREVGQLVRWVSIRPDPRHAVRNELVGAAA